MRTVPTVTATGVRISAFWRWWSGELSGLSPTWLRQAFAKRTRRIVLAADNDGAEATFRLWSETVRGDRVMQRRELGDGALTLAEWLPELVKRLRASPKATVCIRLQHQACLVRTVTVPWTARSRLTGILNLDIERVTPFRRSEVYCDHLAAAGPTPDGRLPVQQIIVERARVDAWLDALTAAGCPVGRVDCWNAQGTAPLPVNLLGRQEPAAGSAGLGALTWVLALTVLLLGAAAVWADFDRHERALAEIDTRQQVARKELAALRTLRAGREAAEAETARLIARKQDQQATVVLIDDIARALPDDSWLSSLHIEGQTADLFGFSSSATALVQTLQAAPSGPRPAREVRLTAPITFDTGRKAEQFSLRLIYAGAAPTRAAALASGSVVPAAAVPPSPVTE